MINLGQPAKFFLFLILTHSCVSKNEEIVRDEKGNIIFKYELKNGVRHGKCYQYYLNGTIATISNWVKGVQEGETISYYENGSIKQSSMWKENKANGECIDYYENGTIKVKQYVINDQPTKREFYDEDGRLEKIHK